MSDRDGIEWSTLIANALEPTVTNEEQQQLYGVLQDHPDVRREFVQQMMIDTELRELLRSENVAASIDAGVLPVAEPAPTGRPQSHGLAVTISLVTLFAAGTVIVSMQGRSPDKVTRALDSPSDVAFKSDHASVEEISTSPPDRNEKSAGDAPETPGRGLLNQIYPPAVQAARDAARRTESKRNLRQIILALHRFHEEHKRFPALYSTDASGKPLLSWRVHLLPHLGEAALYARFQLNEPWDSDHNLRLLKHIPKVLRSPESPADGVRTSYLAISSDKSVMESPARQMFGKEVSVSNAMSDVTDGTANTIVVVEVDSHHSTEWTRPVDFRIKEEKPLQGLGHERDSRVFLALFADTSVHTIPTAISPKRFIEMTTRNGGEPVELP